MRLLTAYLSSFLIMSSAAFATNTWDTSLTRGLDVYSIAGKTSSVKLICDPETVFGENADETKLIVQLAGTDAQGQVHIAFDSADVPTISLEFAHGVSLKKAADSTVWNNLIKGLSSGSQFALVTKDAKEIYVPKKALETSCI